MSTQTKNKRKPDGVTLKTVAAAASVSPMTISNVINENFHQMGAEVRERVERAIRELRYRPHSPARSLRNSLHYSVGLVIVDKMSAFLAHPGHSQIAAGLSNVLSTRGYTLAVQGISPGDFEQVTFLKRATTDALCAILSGDRRLRMALVGAIERLGQPAVIFHEPKLECSQNTCVIRHDDYSGGHRLAQLLIARGCQKLLILIPAPTWPAMLERTRGMKAAVLGAKAVSCDVLRVADLSALAVHSVLDQYLLQHLVPDGLLAGNDQLAIGALMYFKQKGISIPGGIKITGFNAFDCHQYTEPSLTSFHVPSYEMGQRAGVEILKKVETGRFSASEIILHGELALGGSS